MNFIKKYKAVILIVLFAFIIRLINLDKTGGLWYDEINIYSIASQSFPAGMMKADAHRFLLFPLYYIIYHLWITLFGNSDLIIRLMSVFFDILSIGAAFFAGKTLGEILEKDEKFNIRTGTIYALLYAVNSSFIYYAQEAKFYSLAFFLINLLVIFWLKFLKNTDKKHFWLFYITNILLIYTYTSQILFTLLVYGVTMVYFAACSRFKENFKYLLILLSAYIPLAVFAIYIKHYFSGNFDAVVYDNSFILLAVQNYFSPVLAGVQNNILDFQNIWLKGMFNFKFWLFVMYPVLLILGGICISLKKDNISRYIIAVPLLYLAFHITASNLSYYKVLVRYTLMILPLLLLLASAGICAIKNTKLQNTLLIFYVIISILGIFTINGAVNIKRPDGYREVAEALIANSVNPQADFVLPIRVGLLDKYYKIQGEKFSLYILNGEEAQKTYLTAEEINGIKNDKQNLHKYYKRYLLTNTPDKNFENYIRKEFLKSNDVVIITDRTISMFTGEQIRMIIHSGNYEKFPIQFLRLSKLNNDLLYTASKNLKLKQRLNVKNWEIFVFGI